MYKNLNEIFEASKTFKKANLLNLSFSVSVPAKIVEMIATKRTRYIISRGVDTF